MDAMRLESGRQAIRQLVLKVLALHARQFQPVELIWDSDTSGQVQWLHLYVQNKAETHRTIPFSHSQLESAVRPHDPESYRTLQDYIERSLQPLID
jgi:hypothetical protein